MRKLLAIPAALALAACQPVTTQSTSGPVHIDGGPGGFTGSMERRLAHLERNGQPVTVSGDLYSDHAFGVVSRDWSHVCAERSARFHFHAAADIGGTYNAPGTSYALSSIHNPHLRADFSTWLWQREDNPQRAVSEWMTRTAPQLAAIGAVNLC